MNNPTASELLHRATNHLDDRAKTYDSAAGERSAGKTAAAFNAITGNKLTAGDVYLLLTILKMVRSRQGAFKQDNYEDGAAYFALAGEADAVYAGCGDLQTVQNAEIATNGNTRCAAGDRREVELPKNVALPMRFIPKGTFQMGSPETEEGYGDERPQHEVTLTDDFWLGESPVTQEQWLAFMKENPSHFKGDRLPVEQVTWHQALEFCEKLTRHLSGEKDWEGMEFTLPTEAQWEYACRGGSLTPFYWGAELNGTQANCDGDHPFGTTEKGPYIQKTTAVGTYAEKNPHPWGLTDVHGNVREWCFDGPRTYGDRPVNNPEGSAESGLGRVVRGGSWFSLARGCRSAFRDAGNPGDRLNNQGFRVAAVHIRDKQTKSCGDGQEQ